MLIGLYWFSMYLKLFSTLERNLKICLATTHGDTTYLVLGAHVALVCSQIDMTFVKI